MRRSRSAYKCRELWQPHTHRRRVVVHNVINPRLGCQRSDRRYRRVLDVDPRPYALTLADEGCLLLSNIIGGGAVRVVPGPGAVEEAVTQGNTLHRAGCEHASFKRGVGLSFVGNARAGIDR